MLDIKFIKENADFIREGARKKHINFDLAPLLDLEEKRVLMLRAVEEMRAKQNAVSDKIGKGEGNKDELIVEMTELKGVLKEREEKLQELMREWRAMMLLVPNVPDVSVP